MTKLTSNTIKSAASGLVGSGSNSRILRSMFVVGIFVLLGKFAGAGKEVVIAYRHGTSLVVDAYVFSYALVSLLPMIWTVVLATAYPPLHARLQKEHRAEEFIMQLLLVTVLLGAVLNAFFYWVVPELLPHILVDRSEAFITEMQAETAGLSWMVLPLFLCGFYAAFLLAQERHANSMSEGIPSVVIMLFLLVPSLGINPSYLVISTVVGVVLQFLFLMWLGGKKIYTGRLGFSSSGGQWRLFRQALGVLLLSQLLMSVVAPIDLYLASLQGDGSVATFGYSQRILMLGMTLGATAIARALLPVISAEESDGQDTSVKVCRWAYVLFALGCVVGSIGWFLVPSVVELLFQRGEFTADDTARVAHSVRFGLTQLPVYFAGVALLQLFAARHRYADIFYSSMVAISVKVAFGWLLASHYGIAGVMVSNTLMYFSTFIYFLIRLQRQHYAPVRSGS